MLILQVYLKEGFFPVGSLLRRALLKAARAVLGTSKIMLRPKCFSLPVVLDRAARRRTAMRSRCPLTGSRRLYFNSLLLMHILFAATATASESEASDKSVCAVDESTCRGGVLVDGECWRVGQRGQSCVSVCAFRSPCDQTL